MSRLSRNLSQTTCFIQFLQPIYLSLSNKDYNTFTFFCFISLYDTWANTQLPWMIFVSILLLQQPNTRWVQDFSFFGLTFCEINKNNMTTNHNDDHHEQLQVSGLNHHQNEVSTSSLSPSFSISSWWRSIMKGSSISHQEVSSTVSTDIISSTSTSNMTTLPSIPTSVPTSEIYDACLLMNWVLAEELCTIHPLSVQYQDGDTLETPLYIACQNQPPITLIETLIRHWPQATITKSRNGDIPIHIACRYNASIHVIDLLLQSNISTASFRTRFGTTPIMAIWDNYCTIIQENETTQYILTNIRNYALYLHYLDWRHYYKQLNDRHRYVHPIQKKFKLKIPPHSYPLQSKYDKTILILKTLALYRRELYNTSIHHTQQQQQQQQSTKANNDGVIIQQDSSDTAIAETTITDTKNILYILHATMSLRSIGCPLWVLFYVTKEYTEQYKMIDETGRLPIHIAVGPENPFCSYTQQHDRLSSITGTRTHHHHQHWKFIPKEYWSIRLSIEYYPESVLICDPNEPNGRYPLHMAILYGHQWDNGIQFLADAAPHMLHTIDLPTGLYPFQLAATICTTNNNHDTTGTLSSLSSTSSNDDLDLIYELLKHDPTVLQFCYSRTTTTIITSTTNDTIPQKRRRQQQPIWKQHVYSGIVVLFAMYYIHSYFDSVSTATTTTTKGRYSI